MRSNFRPDGGSPGDIRRALEILEADWDQLDDKPSATTGGRTGLSKVAIQKRIAELRERLAFLEAAETGNLVQLFLL